MISSKKKEKLENQRKNGNWIKNEKWEKNRKKKIKKSEHEKL